MTSKSLKRRVGSVTAEDVSAAGRLYIDTVYTYGNTQNGGEQP